VIDRDPLERHHNRVSRSAGHRSDRPWLSARVSPAPNKCEGRSRALGPSACPRIAFGDGSHSRAARPRLTVGVL
jgi:hypothetical protein